jgi:hypothetical protein
MHARQSVTSTRDTEPAGNSEKSNTSRACFAFDGFAPFAPFDATAFLVDFDATGFFDAANFFEEDFFDDFGGSDFFDAEGFFDTAAFLPAAPFFTFDAEGFALAFAAGLALFAAVFRVLLVAAI